MPEPYIEGIVEKLWREMCDLAVGESFSYNFGSDDCARLVALNLAREVIRSRQLGTVKIQRKGRNLTVRRTSV